MEIAIAIAVVAAIAAIAALSALLGTRKRLAEESAHQNQEIQALQEERTRDAARIAELESQLAAAATKSSGLETRIADLTKLTDRARQDQTTQRRFFGKKARATFELLKQRLTADGFPERIDLVASAEPKKVLSEEAKRLEKEVESWMEQGGGDEASILQVLAVLDFARNDFKRAELRLRAASRVSSDPLLWENLGDLMRLAGKPKRAAESYKNAAKTAKDDSSVHRKLGLSLFSTAEYAAAVKPLSLAMQTNPEELDLQLKMARALIESGDLQRAVDLTQTGGKRFPNAPQLPALAIVAFARMKRFRDAQGAFERAIAIDAKSADAHVARGFAFLDEGKPNEAIASFRSATEADPDRAEAHYGLGFAANRAQSYDEALTNLKRAVDLKPDYAEAWYAMKTTYDGLKKFNAAVDALNRAVALNPHLTA